MTPDTILKTKLFIPPLREGIIIRSRLIQNVNEGLKKKVLLVSAPAGFGKSTLLAEWASQATIPVAWVSLDKSENDPIYFLSYLITSVQTIWGELGDAILSTLRSPGFVLDENLLNAWINEISEHTKDFVLVLDDLHHIQNKVVLDLICNLIDHQPEQLHLLLASRADLPISCSRLRARGELNELGIIDLRFTPEETVIYLKSQLGSKITENDGKTLHKRTEGWIAGLQMAVLSLKSSNDIPQYVEQFSAQNRYVTDYLLDEVLLRQSDEIKKFLLATSILEKFNASLCDQVVGIKNSQEIIEQIESSGLFTIPLDTTRTWYRYHHLFADLLRKRLDKSQSFVVADLHRKASDWFSDEEMLEECIDHAFAIKEYSLVIKRIEKLLNQIIAQGQFRNYLAWVRKIPMEYLEKKPRLEIVKVYMLHEMGKFDERDKQLSFVENLLGPLPENIEKCSSGEILNHGILAAIKAVVYVSGYFLVADAFRFAELANQLLPEDHMLWRAMAAGTNPFLNRALGNFDKAIEGYIDVLELDRQAGFTFQAFIAYSALTKTYLETGKLKLAMITCQKALDMDIKYGANLPFAKLAYLFMGELMYEAGQLSSAESYIEMALEHVVRHGDIYSIIDGYFILARIQLANQDHEQAIALIREMKAVINELSPSKNAKKIINACEAFVILSTPQWEQAEAWISEPGFDKLDGDYLFDLESHAYVGIYRVSQNPIRIYIDLVRMTLARFYIAKNKLDDGMSIVADVLHQISQGGRIKHKIEALVIKSILLKKMNRKSEAVTVCHEAISLAASEGFFQIFFNEGETIIELLNVVKEVGTRDIEEQVFILKLLENNQMMIRRKSDQYSNEPDQLTQREIEVLECLAPGPSFSQAAEILSISRNTLKTHTKRIYQKLGVSGLLQALNKAKELKLLK